MINWNENSVLQQIFNRSPHYNSLEFEPIVVATAPYLVTAKNSRFNWRSCPSRNGNRGRSDQNCMSNNACCHKYIIPYREWKTHRPHNSQYLQNLVSNCDIFNITYWADLMIEYKIPWINDESSYSY